MIVAAELTGRERVLDLGCGTGHTTLAFAARCDHAEGLDLTVPMLEEGRRMAADRGAANIGFREGDAADLPYPDASFDVVTSRLSAHHYTRPEQAVREAARVLAPGGRLLLIDSVSPQGWAEDTFFNTFELLRDPSHVRNHSTSQWCGMLEAAGFSAEVLRTWNIRIDFASWVARVATPELEVAMLRSLFASAIDELRDAFGISGDGSFDIPAALLRARLRPSS
jgi:SAM-dependent methyltransferase